MTNEPATSAVDRDRASLLRRADLALVDRDREHPVLERCLDRILVGVVRQVQGTLKAAVGALHTVEATFLLLLFLALLATHHQHVVVEGDLDVLLLDTGHFQGNLVGTVAKLAMRQRFVLFKGLTFQKLCLPGAFRPGDHHNKMLRPGLCVVHASPQYL